MYMQKADPPWTAHTLRASRSSGRTLLVHPPAPDPPYRSGRGNQLPYVPARRPPQERTSRRPRWMDDSTKTPRPRDTPQRSPESHVEEPSHEELLTYTFRRAGRGDEKRRGAYTERVSATHTPRGAVGRGANRWDPDRGGAAKMGTRRAARGLRDMGAAKRGGLEPGIAERQGDEAVRMSEVWSSVMHISHSQHARRSE